MAAGRLVTLGTLIVSLVLACGGSPPATPSPAPGGQPTVIIESPTNGSPAPVSVPLVVTARATDAVGVGRIDLRVGGIVVDTSGPQGATMAQYTAQLQWLPTADGVETLEVIAYRSDGTASEPATVLVAIVLPGGTLPPGFSPTPGTGDPGDGPTPTPGVTPTAAARPTLPPFATPTLPPTPSPTPSPTASPTDPPTELDMAIEVVPAELPSPLLVGTAYTVTVYVYNNSSIQAPPMNIRIRLCNTTGGCGGGDADVTITTSALEGNTALDYSGNITPQIAGERQLRVRLQLPAGYVDPTPNDNLVQFNVTVQAP